MKPYPTLGILYISSFLKERGFHVEVFDSTFQTRSAFRRFLAERRPGIVGIYVNLMTKISALSLILDCRSAGARVIVGGPEVPYYGEEFISHGADIAVIGEGELTLAELIPWLTKNPGKDPGHIPGILYRNGEGMIVRTVERALITDLDSMPEPDRDAIDISRYIRVWRQHHGKGSVSLICARGCPFTCTWCSRSVFGETHRRRSPARVVDEIAGIIDRYGPDMLWFADDVFTINHRWFETFYSEMRKRGIAIPFECISRADRLNDELLRKMSDIGCVQIWYGSESGSQRILDAMQRRVRVDQIRDVTRQAQRYGIKAGLFVMLGYPGEEMSDIEATVDHLVEAEPDSYLTTVAYPIKGTPFYEEVKDHLIVPGDWKGITDRSLDFAGRPSKRFYWFATRYLNNEVTYRTIRKDGGIPSMARVAALVKSRIARLGMRMTINTKA